MISALLLSLFVQIENPQIHPKTTIIVLDDVGYESLALANTPNIDSLSQNGTVFINAWSSPLCSPTRAAILTGRHGFRTGVGGLVQNGDPTENDLSPGEIILPEMLSVTNAAYGKWHLGQSPNHPNLTGFRHYAGSRWNVPSYYNYQKTINGSSYVETEFNTKNVFTDALNSSAIFRYIAFNAAHAPWNQPPPQSNASTELEIHIAQIENVDYLIGRLLLNYDGYIILLSDNGSPNNLGIGGMKGSLDERGINIPFIVSGPGVLAQVRDDLINVTDIFATLAEMYGRQSAAEDSISFASVIFNNMSGNRAINFSEFFEDGDVTQFRDVAVRNATHKLRIDIDGHSGSGAITETLYGMPGQIVIIPPYTGNDLINYNILTSVLQNQYEY